MERKRLVSVIVPTRDRPQLLRKALASIRAVEGPDLSFEILVGDNGESEETENAVAEFGGIYLKQCREGPAAARNIGLRIASGEFIAFLDDDDEWAPGNIRPQIALFDADPGIDAIFGQIVYVSGDLTPQGEPWPAKWPVNGRLFITMLNGYYPQLGATMIRSGLLEPVGLMDEKLIGDEDWDWQLRIARSHRVSFLPRPCVFCRTRPAGCYDGIQILRIKYCGKVFRRHALPNLKLWKSPLGLAKTYAGALAHYHRYFVDAAISRAATGDCRGARRALYQAFRLNPVRSSKMMRDIQFRTAVKKALLSGLQNYGSKAKPKTRQSGLDG